MRETQLDRARTRRATLLAATAALCAATACGGASGPAPAVALVVRGEPAPGVLAAARRADLGVDLRITQAPSAGPATPGVDTSPIAAEVEERVAAARAEYVSGELSRVRSCAERLGDPNLVWASLARRSRSTAARVLVWRIACASISRRDAAVEAARIFGALGLELPAEVEAIPVEAHRILTAALHDAETAPKRELLVRVSGADRLVPAAQVIVDGRVACTSECIVTVGAGDHLVQVEKDGWTPASRIVRVVGETKRTETTLVVAPAPPELAGAQWARTYGPARDRADGNESVALLAQSLRARRIIYMDADALGNGVRVRGALAVDGRVESRDERRGDVETASSDALHELLVKGGVVENKSVFKKPLFWVAVGAVAIASSALTAYLLYDPGSRTEVRTR